MVFILILIVVLLIVHAVLIENYRRWFLKIKPFEILPDISAKVSFTVIIPARNEEDRIAPCLQTVLAQHYPTELCEVIVVDDYSTDNTAAVIQDMQQQFPNLHLL